MCVFLSKLADPPNPNLFVSVGNLCIGGPNYFETHLTICVCVYIYMSTFTCIDQHLLLETPLPHPINIEICHHVCQSRTHPNAFNKYQHGNSSSRRT